MSGIFSKPKTPKPPPPVRMADPYDPALIEARKQKAAAMQRRGGRESTILSDELSGASGSLGG